MGKLAFLYPGQGSQKVGMGAELPATARWLERADEASGLPVSEHVAEGPMEALTRTDMAQPALFAVSMAATEAAREAGLEADFVAGHSLGEYTAAAAAGAVAAEDGVRLVSERGRLMNEIQSERPGAMAAVIGLEAEQVRELCERASQDGLVAPANVNSPTQIVASGEEPAIERLVELARRAGAKRALRLQVGAAFHSELMKPVQARMEEAMAGLDWSDPRVPLASNASGRLVDDAGSLRAALVAQIASPVLWVDCVRTLVDAGCTHFLELGPGRVLGGLVRQLAGADVQAASADSPAGLEQFAASYSGGSQE